MTTDPAATRENILKSAEAEFLAQGFSGASLRKIAAGAGVTTGALYRHFADKADLFDALVSPCFHGFIATFKQLGDRSMAALCETGLDTTWATSEEDLLSLTSYIYDNLPVFQLLLFAAEKTAYENFTHRLIDMEVEMTQQYMALARQKGHSPAYLNRDELHMLVNAQFSAFFEMVLHDVPRDTAIAYTRRIHRFFTAGWREVFFS